MGRHAWDAVVLDYHFGAVTATDLFRNHAESLLGAALIVVSASETQDVVIETLRNGAVDFLPKSESAKPDVLSTTIDKAVAASRRLRLDRRRSKRRCRLLLRRAESDALTGLANRAYFERRVNEGSFRNDRRRRSCVMIDVDFFKQVNDQHGHAAGDEVLREVAKVLRAELPAGATLVRWGGEEFAVVLAESDVSRAFAWADRIRERIAGLRVDWQGQSIRVTASLGVTCPRLIQSIEASLMRADKLLYVAKKMGRNRVASHGHRRLLRAVRAVRREETETLCVRLRRRQTVDRLSSRLRPTQHDHVGIHCDRVANQAAAIACRMSLSPRETHAIRQAACLHDLGKAAVPESVLGYVGRLSSEQWCVLDQHAEMSAWAAEQLGAAPEVVWLILHHHDRFDRAKGMSEALPLLEHWTLPMLRRASGVLALADAVVTMRSTRSYASAMSEPSIVAEVERLSGRQFCPEASSVFLSMSRGRPREPVRLALAA